MSNTETKKLALECVYDFEKNRASKLYMTQPLGGGRLKKYTWGETMKEARRMATYLKSFGFEPGTKIAILSKNCAHFMISDLAIWMAGYVSVAMYPTLTAEDITYILEHSESKFLFVGKLDTWDKQKDCIPKDLPCLAYPLAPPTDYPKWDDIIKDNEPLKESPVPSPEDTSMLIYTSGSTGTPKGVEHTFRSISAMPPVVSDILSITGDDRMISYLPLAHAFERCAVELLSFHTPIQVFFAESIDTFVQDLQRARPTLFHSVPRLWLKFQLGVLKKLPQKKMDLLLKIPVVKSLIKKKVLTGLGLNETRVALTGSAPVPPELITWYRNLGLELLEGYAMSEDFIYSHLSMPGKARVGYVGNVVPGAEAKISDEGEILLKSPGDMKGYYKQEELTKECYTEDGFFKTGDRGEYDSQGRLKITGRVKEIFKSQKGKYISPAPIENLLNADNNIELSCVTGRGLKAPVALVQLSEDQRAQNKAGRLDRDAVQKDLESLMESVNSQLDSWERLSAVVVCSKSWEIDNGFLTPTMKIKRAKIDEEYESQLEGWCESSDAIIWE